MLAKIIAIDQYLDCFLRGCRMNQDINVALVAQARVRAEFWRQSKSFEKCVWHAALLQRLIYFPEFTQHLLHSMAYLTKSPVEGLPEIRRHMLHLPTVFHSGKEIKCEPAMVEPSQELFDILFAAGPQHVKLREIRMRPQRGDCYHSQRALIHRRCLRH